MRHLTFLFVFTFIQSWSFANDFALVAGDRAYAVLPDNTIKIVPCGSLVSVQSSDNTSYEIQIENVSGRIPKSQLRTGSMVAGANLVDGDTLTIVNGLVASAIFGDTYKNREKLAAAILQNNASREELVHGSKNVFSLWLRVQCARLHARAGDFESAIKDLESLKSTIGELDLKDHSLRLDVLFALGETHQLMKKPGISNNHFKSAHAEAIRLFGENHAEVLSCLRRIAQNHLAKKESDEAIAVQQDAVKCAQNVYGIGSPPTISETVLLANAFHKDGKTGKAVDLLKATLPAENLGPSMAGELHFQIGKSLSNMHEWELAKVHLVKATTAFQKQGFSAMLQFAEASQLLKQAEEKQSAK